MTPVLESNSRQSLFGDAMASVVEAANAGRILRVDQEVARLLGSHPGCPVMLDELKNYIMNFAANVGAPIEVDLETGEEPAYFDGLIKAFPLLPRVPRDPPRSR